MRFMIKKKTNPPQPLDFEDTPQLQLSISVENEVPYFSCKVLEKTSAGLWKTSSSGGGGSPAEGSLRSVQVDVSVEDVNDPPEFSHRVVEVALEENSPVGTRVERVTAVDQDSRHARDFV